MSWTANNLTGIAGIAHGFLGIDEALPPGTLFCNQKHTADVLDAAAAAASCAVGDGVFTGEKTPVAVLTADCLPVLIASRDGQHVAAVHGGWKGLQAGILDNALARFDQAGVDRGQLRIAIGPSIKPCCYEVSAEFASLWPDCNPPWQHTRPAPTRPNALPQPPAMNEDGLWFDLAAYAGLLLAHQDIDAQQVEVSDICTCCHTQALGSYRRRTHWPAARTQQFSWIARV
ncbi:hypothetical protein PMM47T1_10695 [Pseudomonas sp. M47T1]|uniref:polyphenol oxidase family protein n=1 Tax=unclassified Pseudomonas TaxID=196821 RepID=UPI0002607B16|nr:polyphenol oxidase family protein [Pseudomonas sp. M47T1]EIK96736.1 hypothetical protein PMM47T1_10695 [Pseudomonas sp. M47T1]